MKCCKHSRYIFIAERRSLHKMQTETHSFTCRGCDAICVHLCIIKLILYHLWIWSFKSWQKAWHHIKVNCGIATGKCLCLLLILPFQCSLVFSTQTQIVMPYKAWCHTANNWQNLAVKICLTCLSARCSFCQSPLPPSQMLVCHWCMNWGVTHKCHG